MAHLVKMNEKNIYPLNKTSECVREIDRAQNHIDIESFQPSMAKAREVVEISNAKLSSSLPCGPYF